MKVTNAGGFSKTRLDRMHDVMAGHVEPARCRAW